MTTNVSEAPAHGSDHEQLEKFLGEWRAKGTSYEGTDQSGDDLKANGVAWASTHSGRWHTGEVFLVQDERAVLGGNDVFDTLSVMGVNAATGRCFSNTFENHGFSRCYDVKVDGDRWEVLGDLERATITFSDNNRQQTIVWEWKRGDHWLPLCDRTAMRTD